MYIIAPKSSKSASLSTIKDPLTRVVRVVATRNRNLILLLALLILCGFRILGRSCLCDTL